MSAARDQGLPRAASPGPDGATRVRRARAPSILCDAGTITAELLAIDSPLLTPAEINELEGEAMSGSLEEYFRKFVLEHQHRLSETELAKRLGISRKALWEKRHRLGIPRPKLQA